jgi:hypothetical protein
MLSQYLRILALRSLSHSRDCFDLKSAERFRLLADDLLSKAGELEADEASLSIALPKARKVRLRDRAPGGDSSHEV